MAIQYFEIGLVGLTVFIGFFALMFFEKTKISDILILIFFGMLLGPIFGLIETEILSQLAPFIGTLALIVIVLDGSMRLNFLQVMQELTESSWFTLIGVILSSILTAFVAFMFGFEPANALLFGLIMAGTSYEIIVPMINKLKVKPSTRTLLNLESAFNGAITIVLVIALIQFIKLGFGEVDVIDPFKNIASAFAVGTVLAIISSFVWVRIIKLLDLKNFVYIMTLAWVLIFFTLTEALGGNGIIAVLVFGIFIGNFQFITNGLGLKSDFSINKTITKFQAEVSFFVRTMFFVFTGIILSLSAFNFYTILFAFVVFLVLMIARFFSVKLLAAKNKNAKKDQEVIFAMMPHGLSTAVLASMPIAFGLNLNFTNEAIMLIILTNIFTTFAVYLFDKNISLFGLPKRIAGLPVLRVITRGKWLDSMVEEDGE